jgi:plasmid stabilization system protein ParE
MSAKVVTSPQADDDIRAIDTWWRENRPAARGLFSEELTEAMVLLAASPEMGRAYRDSGVARVQRLILRATRYHVYYVTDGELVTVLAVWSAVRGRGPRLFRPR